MAIEVCARGGVRRLRPVAEGTADDQARAEPRRAAREARRRGLPPRDRRSCPAAHHGDRRRGRDRRRPARAGRRAHDLAQGLPRPGARHPARDAEPACAEAPAGFILPGLSRAASNLREGAGRRRSGSVDRRGLDPADGRTRPVHGPQRDLQEHGIEALRGHRREGRRVPEPAAHRRPALSLAGLDLPQGPPGRPDRERCGSNRRRREHRRAAREVKAENCWNWKRRAGPPLPHRTRPPV